MALVTVNYWGVQSRPAPRSFQVAVAEPATVGKAVRQVAQVIGGAEAAVVEAELLATAAFLVNGEMVGHRGGVEAPLASGDTLGIVMAVSGGVACST